MLIHSDACPLCDCNAFKLFKVVKDYLKSGETFELKQCTDCNLIFTSPFPAANEIMRYYESADYVSHSKNNSGISNLPYRLARMLMLRRKLSWLQSLKTSETKLLDFGCGIGTFLNYLIGKQWDAWGVEPNQEARQAANQLTGNRVFSNLSQLPENHFDFITLWHVLEHVYSLNQTIASILNYLNPQGYLIIAVPNCASYDASYYKEQWAAYDVPRHLIHFTPATINLLAKKHKLQLIRTIPLKLDAYYISMLSEKYGGGSVLNGLYQGFKSNLLAKKNQYNYSSLVYILKK
ncbi:MAG: hypothetical protein DHS20C17_22010 [Cyclobacteriaceae bacterium]|nr:MAG: hypothetical protein DHS20C17_22010 [Cyclobacteriaceae bacterium]